MTTSDDARIFEALKRQLVSLCFAISTLEDLQSFKDRDIGFREELPQFGDHLMQSLWSYAILEYSRLVGPARTNGQKNLCFEWVICSSLFSEAPAVREVAESMLQDIKRRHRHVDIARHKLIAHLDLLHLQGKHSIRRVSLSDLRDAAEDLVKLGDHLSIAHDQSGTAYWDLIIRTDAKTMIRGLARARRFMKLFHRMEELDDQELRAAIWSEFRQGPYFPRRR